MDTGVLIGEVGRRTGIALDRTDPVLIVATVASIVAEQHAEEVRAGTAELKAVVATAQPKFSGENMRTLGSELRPELQQYARVEQIKVFAIAMLTAVALLIGAVGLGYYLRGDQALVAGVTTGKKECHLQDGGEMCAIWIWSKLPPPGTKGDK